MNAFNHYIVTLAHDNGRVKVKTYAQNVWKAVEYVIDAERAPVGAVESVEKVNPNACVKQAFPGGRW